MQPTLICSHPWNSRSLTRRQVPGAAPPPGKACGERVAGEQLRESLCTWPGPNATSTNGKRSNTSSFSDCAQQPPTPTIRSGRSRFRRLASPRCETTKWLSRGLADRARVEQDQVGLAALGRLLVAERLVEASPSCARQLCSFIWQPNVTW